MNVHHLLNEANLRKLMGCIDGICEISVNFDIYYSDVIIIKHVVPPHVVTYKKRDLPYEDRDRSTTLQQDLEHTTMFHLDPYLLQRSEKDVDDMVERMVDSMRHRYNREMPRHA